MAKNRPPKPKSKTSASSISLLLNVPKELQHIDKLIAASDFDQAMSDLRDLAERAPHRADVFEMMIQLGIKTNDFSAQLEGALRLAELQPYVAVNHYNLLVVYLKNNLPALACEAGQYFLNRWPDSKLSKDVQKLLEEVRLKLLEQPLVAQFPCERRVEILTLHDRAVLETSRGNYENVIAHTTKLIQQEPAFIPAYNNRALAHWFMGQNEAAIVDTQLALDRDANNIHALSNLVRFLRLQNRIAEAQVAAARIKALSAVSAEALAKQAEAFAYLADDAAVLALAASAEADDLVISDARFAALFYLHCGVAAARLDDETQARAFLGKALAHSMTDVRAQQQLADLDKPVGQREGPCAMVLDHWIPRRLIEEFVKILEAESRAAQPSQMKANMQKYFGQYPHLLALIPVLLERGDRVTRDLAHHMARLADTPELWQVLKDFASSPHGPDHFRNQVLTTLQDAGQFTKGEAITFWSRGKATQVKLSRHRIDDQRYAPIEALATQQAAYAAVGALKRNDLEQALEILQEALRADPTCAQLQYDLAVLYLRHGRVAQAREFMEKLVEQHPSFAAPRCELAMFALANERKEEFHAHLEALSALEHFHYGEYAQFCRLQMLYQILVESDFEAARHWFEVWEGKMPHDPRLKVAREALNNRLTSKQWARQGLAVYRERQAQPGAKF